MPVVRSTKNIQRHVQCPELGVAGGNVRDVLDRVFDLTPTAKSYVLACVRMG